MSEGGAKIAQGGKCVERISWLFRSRLAIFNLGNILIQIVRVARNRGLWDPSLSSREFEGYSMFAWILDLRFETAPGLISNMALSARDVPVWLDDELGYLSYGMPCCMVSKVTCFEYFDQLLPREDPDAAKCLEKALLKDGLTIRLGEHM